MIVPNEPQETPDWVLPPRGTTGGTTPDERPTIPPNVELGTN